MCIKYCFNDSITRSMTSVKPDDHVLQHDLGIIYYHKCIYMTSDLEILQNQIISY